MDKYDKKIRSSKTISEKYEIIIHYEKLVNENKVQYPKAETVKHFKLKQTSSLNTILAKSSEIKKSFIENQSSETRMRFKNSKYSDIDEELYAYFLKMREKKAQINTNDLKSKALEIGIGKGYDRFANTTQTPLLRKAINSPEGLRCIGDSLYYDTIIIENASIHF